MRKSRVILRAGKSRRTKGVFAETDVSLPEAASVGTLQNMQCTVTVVERYQIFDIIDFIDLLRYSRVSELIFFMEVIP